MHIGKQLNAAAQRGELGRVFLADVAYFQALYGERGWEMRRQAALLPLDKKALLPIIDGEPHPRHRIMQAREEAWKKELQEKPKEELAAMRDSVLPEIEAAWKQGNALLAEYAKAVAQGVPAALAAMEKGVRARLQGVSERIDGLDAKFSALMDLVGLGGGTAC